MRFKILTGSYQEGNKLYLRGDILSTINPLDEMFGAASFQRLSDEKPLTPAKPVSPQGKGDVNQNSQPNTIVEDELEDEETGEDVPLDDEGSDEDEKPEDNQDDEVKPDGECVDDKFDFDPEELDLHVYYHKQKYFVYDVDDMKTPLNEKGLKKAEVMPFIDSQCV